MKHHGRSEQNSGKTDHAMITSKENNQPHEAAECLLAHVHWWWWWRRSRLLAGGEDGGSRDEGEDSDFHVCGC